MFTTYLQRFKQLHRSPTVWLGWVAAILYSSWPLGYLLNPAVSRHDLASQLEAQHQPYAWVFIAMDVLTAIVVTIIGIRQINMREQLAVLKWCAVSYTAFGWLVATAALSPLDCNPEGGTCGSFLHNPLLIIHGASSVLSWAFLGIGVITLGIWAAWRWHGVATIIVFAVMLLAWLGSGIGSLAQLLYHIPGNFMQYYFITICSLSVVLLVVTIEHLQPVRVESVDGTPPTVQ